MDKVKNTVTRTFTNVKEKWISAEPKKRNVLLAVVGVIVVSAIVLTVILNNPGYVTIVKGSSDNEVVAMQAALASAGIDDVKVLSGNEIQVKKNVQGLARITLSEKGLPSDGGGFNNDIWETGIDMFSTDSQVRETQKQQLQSWIMANLSSIPEVESSTVILHIPQTKDFVMQENREEARAAVMLSLRTGKTLSSSQIKGIHALVQKSVPELEDFNITVTDGNGVQLIPDDTGSSSSENLALKQQRFIMEMDFKKLMSRSAADQLIPLLDTVFGPESHALSINVDIDFSEEKEVYEEIFTPVEGLDGGIIRDIKRQAAAGGVALEGGAIGTVVDGDISPNYPTIPNVEAGSDFYYEWGENINHEINKRVESYKDTGLRVTKTTASLVVDTEAMTQAQIDTWTGIVANATGASEVTFLPMVFPLKPTPGIQTANPGFDTTKNILIYIIICLGVLLIILFILAITTSGSKKKRLIRNRNVAAAMDGSGGFLREEFVQPVQTNDTDIDLPSLLEENDTKEVVLKREIKEFSQSNPEIIAQLIRTWLRESE